MEIPVSLIFLFLLQILLVLGDHPSVLVLKEYLSQKPDFDAQISWVQEQAPKLGLGINRLALVTKENGTAAPAVWLTWPGTNRSLPSLLLNIPSYKDPENLNSTTSSDSASQNDGYVYGVDVVRMSTAIQYLEAIRNLKDKGVVPDRTVHLTFLQGELGNGSRGMDLFRSTPQFQTMEIGFVLDEGMPNVRNELTLFYTERINYAVSITVTGASGHGSLLLGNTAGEKLQKIINSLLSLREFEKWRLGLDKSLRLGDVTTINLSGLKGGFQANVIPPSLTAVFDIRVTPHWDLTQFASFLNRTCAEAGDGVTYEVLNPLSVEDGHASTELKAGSWWWDNFEAAFHKMNISIVPRIFPGIADGQILRSISIPVLGISTIFKRDTTANETDQLSVDEFLQGIQIYENLIERMVVLPKAPPAPTDQPPKISTSKPIEAAGNSTTTKKPSKSSATSVSISILKFFFSFCVFWFLLH